MASPNTSTEHDHPLTQAQLALFLHPLMLHSASNNQSRKVRLITNPPISVKEPFVFDREDGGYSAVERKTLMALGMERLDGWKSTAQRQKVVPERVRIQEEMKKQEEESSNGRM